MKMRQCYGIKANRPDIIKNKQEKMCILIYVADTSRQKSHTKGKLK
jgi:hypothetical protein